MDVLVCKDSDDVAKRANEWFFRTISEGIGSFYIPAGSTPQKLYQLWEDAFTDPHKRKILTTLQLVPVDEVTSGEKKGLFNRFYHEYLPSFQSQLVPIEVRTQAKAAILGLGINGHVAFHEPGIPEGFEYGPVRLAGKTRAELGLGLSDQAVSYGLGSFAACRKILMMVTGAQKHAIFQKVFMSDDESTPASFLKAHEDFTVLVDEAAMFGKV